MRFDERQDAEDAKVGGEKQLINMDRIFLASWQLGVHADLAVKDRLDYRDGHEQTDVAPVLVDRLGNGGVRVVVRYPHDVRVRARNRFFITVGAVIAWAMVGWQAAIRPRIPWWGWLASGVWPFGPALILIMAMMWRNSALLYALEADARWLRVEVQGRLRTRRREYRREEIRDVRVDTNLRGQAIAVLIINRTTKLNERLFDGMDARHLRIVVDTLREGLGMAPLPAAAAGAAEQV